MREKQFVIKPKRNEWRRYGVTLSYLYQFDSDETRSKFLDASWAFWETLRVWDSQEEKVAQDISYLVALCCRKLTRQEKEIEAHFQVSEDDEMCHEFRQCQDSLGLELRFQTVIETSSHKFLEFLVNGSPYLTESEKYWMPCEAYWGAYAAEALGFSDSTVRSVAAYCLQTLRDQREFLNQTFRKQPFSVAPEVKNPEIRALEWREEQSTAIKTEVAAQAEDSSAENIYASDEALDVFSNALFNSFNQKN